MIVSSFVVNTLLRIGNDRGSLRECYFTHRYVTAWVAAFSFSEPTILMVSARDQDLWPDLICEHAQSTLFKFSTNQIM